MKVAWHTKMRLNKASHWMFPLQVGMLLPVAAFILAVLVAMGAYAMRLSVLASASSTQDFLRASAYQAALAGNQWAAYQVYQPDSASAAMQNCPATTTLTINRYRVEVSCVSRSYVDNGAQTVYVYEMNSVAKIGTAYTQNYVERQVSLTLSRCLQTIAGVVVECS